MDVRQVGCLALALATAGCASPATQLIVVVDTDLSIPSEMDHLTISVTGPSAMAMERDAVLTGAETLPFTLTLVPSGDALGPVDITARARLGLVTTTIVERAARVTLVRGETRVLLLHLPRSCLGVTCPDRGETCTELGCASVESVSLYPWTGTAPRLGDDAGPGFDAGRDGGSFDASRDAPAPNDAGPRDAPMDVTLDLDAAPDCTMLGCDDMNECTEDFCDGATRTCEHRPLDAACDDDLFCNGFDRCGGGSCSVHAGNPCPGMTVCDEARDGCTGCTDDSMCPPPMTGEWSACGGFTDACGNGGSHARIARVFACRGDICLGEDRPESEGCSVDRTGASCLATSCTDFGACNGTDTCATSGMATRTCTDHTCQGGACVASPRADGTPCTRATDGSSCGGASCTGWSACTNDGSCSTAGTHERDCTSPTCSGGACDAVMNHESEGCVAATNGNSCGAASCEAWSACSFSDGCATTGTRSRVCHGPVCAGGSCTSGDSTENEACNRTTDGDVCGSPVCGAFACTGGLGEFECDQDGFEERSCQDHVCGGGTCGLSAPRTESGGACSINLDGNPCSGGGCLICVSGSCQFIC